MWKGHSRGFWLALLLAVLAAFLFTDIGEDWSEPGWGEIEDALAAPILALRSPGLTRVLAVLSALANAPVLVLTILGLLLLPRPLPGWHNKVFFLVYCSLAGVLGQALKYWFIRPRPGADLFPHMAERFAGYPSGHTMMSCCVHGFLAYLCWQENRRGWAAALALLILVIGLSRIYLGFHYPGDVEGGLCLGYVCLFIGANTHQRLQRPALIAAEE